jgi:MoxR-like ATPase
MTTRYYRGDGRAPSETVALPRSRRLDFLSPAKYRADEGLVDAVNVALILGQPLLLTGEPGTGKTQLAYALARELGLGDVLKFETKSTSVAGDLLYTHDVLRRFQHAQSGTNLGVRAYITYNALGRAILQTRPRNDVDRWMPDDFEHTDPIRCVVLIDEVDKAPRDFPNDILNELDQLYFRVPEIGEGRISADPQYRPVVVLTSNSEKDLPDAFLRRCIFYNIPFPDREEMSRIVADRVGLRIDTDDGFLSDALDLFYELRDPRNGLRKRPATAELLDWVATLVAHDDGGNPLADRSVALRTMSSLVKGAQDQDHGRDVIAKWQNR